MGFNVLQCPTRMEFGTHRMGGGGRGGRPLVVLAARRTRGPGLHGRHAFQQAAPQPVVAAEERRELHRPLLQLHVQAAPEGVHQLLHPPAGRAPSGPWPDAPFSGPHAGQQIPTLRPPHLTDAPGRKKKKDEVLSGHIKRRPTRLSVPHRSTIQT